MLGDFNARTEGQQVHMYDFHANPTMLSEIDCTEMGSQRTSQDARSITEYGRCFLDLGAMHELLIFNGMSRWPSSDSLTCFPHGGGASTVDYLMGSPALMRHIHDFAIPPPPIGADRTYLTFTISYTPLPPTPDPPISTYTHIQFHHQYTQTDIDSSFC